MKKLLFILSILFLSACGSEPETQEDPRSLRNVLNGNLFADLELCNNGEIYQAQKYDIEADQGIYTRFILVFNESDCSGDPVEVIETEDRESFFFAANGIATQLSGSTEQSFKEMRVLSIETIEMNDEGQIFLLNKIATEQADVYSMSREEVIQRFGMAAI